MSLNPHTYEPSNTTPQPYKQRKARILLGVTGSVATVKVPELAVKLTQRLNVDVRIVLTNGAQYFWENAVEEYDPLHWKEMNRITTLSSNVENEKSEANEIEEFLEYSGESKIHVHEAKEEWKNWKRLGDSILHINLRDWADLALIAPLSAHTLSKISNGLCDDPLSSCLRAWDFGHGCRQGKPIILAPAMNTAMWIHPLTTRQLDTIQGFWNFDPKDDDNNNSKSISNVLLHGEMDNISTEKFGSSIEGGHIDLGKSGVWVIKPQKKTLACGEVGDGALASVDEIVKMVKLSLNTYFKP